MRDDNERNPPVGNDVSVIERGTFTGVDLANAARSVIFDIEKVKSISKEEILLVFKIENKIKTPQDLLHDSFRDAAKSALEKGRNKKEEEAIREKEPEPYRQTHSSDDDDSPSNTLNKQTIAYYRAVRRQIENEFYKDNLSSVHVLLHRRKQSMKLRERDVVSDAWTVVLGDSDPQSSFHIVKFFQCFPKITDKIKELRDKLNVRVISTTDPLKLATRTDPTTATTTANSLATKTALTASNPAVTTTTTEPTTAHDDN